MSNSTIRIMTGNDNFRSGSATVAAQMLTNTQFPQGADGRRSYYMNDLHRLGMYSVQRVGQQQRLPGAINGNSDLGVWWDASYNVPDGMIIMLTCEINDRGRSFADKGRILIRPRALGPLWRIAVRRIEDPLANQNVNPVIEGRFDFITVAEAASSGAAVVSPNPGVMRLYNMSTWTRLVDYAKLAEGQAVQRVETQTVVVDGKAQQVSSTARGRKINID